MRIWVEFANAYHASNFQYGLYKNLNFYKVKRTEPFTYKFTIIDCDYPIFMETLQKHCDIISPRSNCLTNIVKIK